MAETVNISEIASAVAKDIFRPFRWFMHPKRDDNFACVNEAHLKRGGKPKLSHPGDVVFSYDDPYLGKRVYFHTDLKSYASDSISLTALRAAFKSLAMTVECARESEEWRLKYGVDSSQPHEVRGLLFVHNHDGKHQQAFGDLVEKLDPQTLQVGPGVILAFLGPDDIQRLWTIANDIKRLIADEELDKDFTFFYPDLVLRRRQGELWDQPATLEYLTGPFIFIRTRKATHADSGYVIYYNRRGSCYEEFEYFLDCLSRYQLLDSDEKIRIRFVDSNADPEIKTIFATAAHRYAKAWGFDPAREKILEGIQVDRVTYVTNNYQAGDIGWRGS